MKQVNLKNVKEAGESARISAGAYICTITAVEDVPDKEYLRVSYDIAEGEFKGYYGELRANHPDWAWVGTYVKSYKERALPMFKRFCSAVSKSNQNFVFDGGTVNSDEKTLIGKKLGIILQEEEYYRNDGEKGTRLIVSREFPADQIASQRVPAPKKLKDDTTMSGFVNSTSSSVGDEIPWS